jgi:hypothetical protein
MNSRLYRDKWDRKDYKERTINLAISSCVQSFEDINHMRNAGFLKQEAMQIEQQLRDDEFEEYLKSLILLTPPEVEDEDIFYAEDEAAFYDNDFEDGLDYYLDELELDEEYNAEDDGLAECHYSITDKYYDEEFTDLEGIQKIRYPDLETMLIYVNGNPYEIYLDLDGDLPLEDEILDTQFLSISDADIHRLAEKHAIREMLKKGYCYSGFNFFYESESLFRISEDESVSKQKVNNEEESIIVTSEEMNWASAIPQEAIPLNYNKLFLVQEQQTKQQLQVSDQEAEIFQIPKVSQNICEEQINKTEDKEYNRTNQELETEILTAPEGFFLNEQDNKTLQTEDRQAVQQRAQEIVKIRNENLPKASTDNPDNLGWNAKRLVQHVVGLISKDSWWKRICRNKK